MINGRGLTMPTGNYMTVTAEQVFNAMDEAANIYNELKSQLSKTQVKLLDKAINNEVSFDCLNKIFKTKGK